MISTPQVLFAEKEFRENRKFRNFQEGNFKLKKAKNLNHFRDVFWGVKVTKNAFIREIEQIIKILFRVRHKMLNKLL